MPKGISSDSQVHISIAFLIKAMVNHVLDLDRKLQSSEFNLVQLRFGRQAFTDALKASLSEASSKDESE